MDYRCIVTVTATLACAWAMVVGCTSTQGTKPADPNDETFWVRDMTLSETRGEVGRPFTSELTYKTNYLNNPEFEVSGLPPGLTWDDAKRAIVGAPKSPGFHTVHIAVRSAGEKDWHDKRDSLDRWWPASFEIEIYRPVGD